MRTRPFFNPFAGTLSHEFVKKKKRKSAHLAIPRALDAEVEHLHDAGVVKLTYLR